jgi:hypothetical protein
MRMTCPASAFERKTLIGSACKAGASSSRGQRSLRPCGTVRVADDHGWSEDSQPQARLRRWSMGAQALGVKCSHLRQQSPPVPPDPPSRGGTSASAVLVRVADQRAERAVGRGTVPSAGKEPSLALGACQQVQFRLTSRTSACRRAPRLRSSGRKTVQERSAASKRRGEMQLVAPLRARSRRPPGGGMRPPRASTALAEGS